MSLRGHSVEVNHRNPQTGFTLIEVMIVVAIIGILTAIAVPSYRQYIQRGDRASARAALLEAQQFMERFYAANNRYTKNDAGDAPDLPAALQAVPTEAPKYDLSVATPAANSYTLTATPKSADKCGNLTLTNTGVKGMSAVGPTIQECWR